MTHTVIQNKMVLTYTVELPWLFDNQSGQYVSEEAWKDYLANQNNPYKHDNKADKNWDDFTATNGVHIRVVMSQIYRAIPYGVPLDEFGDWQTHTDGEKK